MLERAAFIVAFAILGLAPGLAAQERPPQPAEAPPPVEAPPPPLAPGEPTGYAGKLLGGQPSPIETSPDFVPISDRWRLGLPNWNRYERPIEAPYVTGKWWDPYNQNVIKGDFPIFGQNIFMNLSAINDTLFEARRIPTASSVSAADPDSADVFGGGDQLFLSQNFILSFELFKGDTAFRPRDWAFRLTGVYNFNYLTTKENGAVNIDVREGIARDEDSPACRSSSSSTTSAISRPNYDFLSTRAGDPGVHQRLPGLHLHRQQPRRPVVRQPGLQPRAVQRRVLPAAGEGHEQRAQYPVRHARPARRHRQLLPPGLPHPRLHGSRAASTTCTTRAATTSTRTGSSCGPAVVGTPPIHTIDAVYLGLTGDGHIGPVQRDPRLLPGARPRHRTTPSRQAATISTPRWPRSSSRWTSTGCGPKFSFFWASGDDKPHDGRGRGFDSILDNPNFAGGGFSYWVRQGIGLPTSGLELTGRQQPSAGAAQQQDRGAAELHQPGPVPLRHRRRLRRHAQDQGFFQANNIRFHTPSRCS